MLDLGFVLSSGTKSERFVQIEQFNSDYRIPQDSICPWVSGLEQKVVWPWQRELDSVPSKG